MLSAALDIVGIFDPTPIADGINAKLSFDKGNWGDGIINAVGIFPYIGDLAKVSKIAKDSKIIKNAIDVVTSAGKRIDPKTGQKLGPSGQAMVHIVKKSSPKQTVEAARRGGKGTPVFHNKDKKGGNHYHSGSGKIGKGKEAKGYGKNAGKISNNVHYENVKRKN